MASWSPQARSSKITSPQSRPPAASAAHPLHHADGQGEVATEASVTLEAGGNTLSNTASLKSYWLEGHVTAVVGKHVVVNAITQVNVVSDHDSIGSSLNDWK